MPPLMAASTERTVPSVNSFLLPDTLTAVLLASPGACVTGEIVIRPLGDLGYPFRLDPFLAFLGRAPAFWGAFSERSAGFAESRPETASSKARR
jgi:hypothetical protein